MARHHRCLAAPAMTHITVQGQLDGSSADWTGSRSVTNHIGLIEGQKETIGA